MKILSKKKLLKKAGIIGEYQTPVPWRLGYTHHFSVREFADQVRRHWR
jgi:hypothetical protein